MMMMCDFLVFGGSVVSAVATIWVTGHCTWRWPVQSDWKLMMMINHSLQPNWSATWLNNDEKNYQAWGRLWGWQRQHCRLTIRGCFGKSKSDDQTSKLLWDGGGGQIWKLLTLFFLNVSYFMLFFIFPLLKLGMESPFSFWNKGNNIKRSERTF